MNNMNMKVRESGVGGEEKRVGTWERGGEGGKKKEGEKRGREEGKGER